MLIQPCPNSPAHPQKKTCEEMIKRKKKVHLTLHTVWIHGSPVFEFTAHMRQYGLILMALSIFLSLVSKMAVFKVPSVTMRAQQTHRSSGPDWRSSSSRSRDSWWMFCSLVASAGEKQRLLSEKSLTPSKSAAAADVLWSENVSW